MFPVAGDAGLALSNVPRTAQPHNSVASVPKVEDRWFHPGQMQSSIPWTCEDTKLVGGWTTHLKNMLLKMDFCFPSRCEHRNMFETTRLNMSKSKWAQKYLNIQDSKYIRTKNTGLFLALPQMSPKRHTQTKQKKNWYILSLHPNQLQHTCLAKVQKSIGNG